LISCKYDGFLREWRAQALRPYKSGDFLYIFLLPCKDYSPLHPLHPRKNPQKSCILKANGMRYRPCNPYLPEAACNAPVSAAAANPTGKTINKEDIPMLTCLKTKKPVLLVLLAILLLILTACGQLSGPAADPAPAEAVEAPAAEAEAAAPAEAAEAPQPAATDASLDGNWANEDPAAPGVTRMTFRTDGGTVYVQMWTHCEEGECAWDELGVPQANPLEITWQTPVAKNLQTITLLADGRLQVDEQITFTDGSGRGDVGMTSYLVQQ
jgi:predicted small lipoprotein YifL